jgi:radical SAM superfamily enzyme YgiQ (UPF0313 family)
VGCSHNKCTFCPAYKEKKFRIKSLKEILYNIDEAADYSDGEVRRVFLCDGDPLIIPQAHLLSIIDYLRTKFDKLQRVSLYGNAKSVLRKSVRQLKELKERKLGIIYLGLESGDPVVLQRIQKGVTVGQMIEAAEKVRMAGIKLSVTVILGLGGKERSHVHALETIRVLNRMMPQYVGALTLMLAPGTVLYQSYKNGEFTLPEQFELIEELRTMIAESQLENCLFFSNHASNYLPIQARLPKDKMKTLEEIDAVLHTRDQSLLRPECLRGL